MMPTTLVTTKHQSSHPRSRQTTSDGARSQLRLIEVGAKRRRLACQHPAPVPDLRSRARGQSVRADRGKPGLITGFRAEEEFGFNAEPYVRTGKFVKILGL